MSIERRKDLRVACRGAYAEMSIGGTPVGVFVIGDVSGSGLFLITPSPTIPSGQRVNLRIDEQKLSLVGEIVHVAKNSDGGSPPGYGIKLDQPPYDTVERITQAATPPTTGSPAPRAPAPSPRASAPAASAGATGETRILIILEQEELGTAMAIALNAFRVGATYLRPDDGLVPALAKLSSSVDVALVDYAAIGVRGRLSAATLKTQVKARTVILFASSLPSAEERARLQSAGIEQLWIAPLNPYEAMDKLHKKVRKR